MKNLRKPLGQDKRGKVATVAALFAVAGIITASGVWFAVCSIVSNISIRVFNSNVPGIVLAVLVVYFGIRSILSVNKLSKEILKDSSFFSWSNFKRAKPAKSR